MACTWDFLCPSKCGRLATPDGPGLGPRHPRRTTCAQFPPLWGNRLTTSGLSQKNENFKKTAEYPLPAPKAQGHQAGNRRTAKGLTISQELPHCQRKDWVIRVTS